MKTSCNLRLIRKDEKLDMNTLIERAISKKYKIPIIEDAAQAIGSKYKNFFFRNNW